MLHAAAARSCGSFIIARAAPLLSRAAGFISRFDGQSGPRGQRSRGVRFAPDDKSILAPRGEISSDRTSPAASRESVRSRSPVREKEKVAGTVQRGEKRKRETRGEGGPNSKARLRASVLTLNYKCSGFFLLAASAPHTSLARARARARMETSRFALFSLLSSLKHERC